MKRNPRPRKYESAAARQAAYKARAEMLEFRAEPKTAASLTSIAQELDVSRSELLLSMVKFALTNHDWARFGLTHKTLPYYQGNPIMATKKASPAQLAARKKFVEMVRSGAFKKSKRAADRDKNPAKKGLYANIDAKKKRITAGSGEKMRKVGSAGAPTNANFRAAAKTAKRNPMESIAGKHLFNLGSNYFATVTLTGYNDYYAQIFYKTTDSSGFTDEQIVPDYKPRHFSTAKAAINSVMKYATKNKLKSNPIGEMREFTVIKWKRGKNTTNGNPVYEFILKDEFGGMHTGKTKPNAGWVYAISSVYEGDKINAALEETKSGRVYMVDYGKRKANPSKRSSSRSAVVPNPKSRYYSTDYQDISDVKKFYSKPYMTYTVFTSKDGEKWSKYSVAYIDKKLAILEAKEVAKRAPTHYIKVESKKNMPVYKK